MPIDSCWNKLPKRALPLVLFTLCACGSDNLPKPQKLGPLRVLGLIASSPEINDSTPTPITITPIISDTTAAGSRTLTFSWKVCPDPGVAFGLEPTCAASAVLFTNSGTIAATDPPLTGAPYSGVTTQFGFTLPTNLLASRTATEASNGIPVLVTYEINGGSETARSFRRITLTSRSLANLNGNVSLSSISGLVSGTPNTFPSSETDLTPVLGSSPDTYTVISSTGETLTRTENLTISWYTTDGEFEFSRTDGSRSNKWTPPSSGTPKGLLILRDDRGGLSLPLTIGY